MARVPHESVKHRARVAILLGAVTLGLAIASGVGVVVWMRRRAEAREAAASLNAEQRTCRALREVKEALDAASARAVADYTRDRWAPPVLRGVPEPGDAREPLLSVGARLDGTVAYPLVDRLVSGPGVERPTFGSTPGPDIALTVRHRDDIDAARAATQHAFVTAVDDIDLRTLRGDYPYTFEILESLMLVDAQGREPLECMREVLDAVRFAQLTRFVEIAPLAPGRELYGLVRARAFDACAARASPEDLDAIAPELASLVEHSIDLGIVWRANLTDEGADSRPFIDHWSLGDPDWMRCTQQAPPSIHEDWVLRLDALGPLRGCSVATLEPCESRLRAIGGLGTHPLSGSVIDALVHVADEETWIRVIALDGALRRARARDDVLDDPPWATDPRSGRPLRSTRPDGEHLSFPGAGGELVVRVAAQP